MSTEIKMPNMFLPTVKFKDLLIKDCFLDGQDLCQKISEVELSEYIDDEQDGANAVNLSTGMLRHFDNNNNVIPVNVEMNVSIKVPQQTI